MDKQSLPSIEKIAAYLDGNLSQEEFEKITCLNAKKLLNLR